MEIRIEHTTDYPWDLLLLADPSRELVDCYLKTSDCFAAFSGDKPVGVIVVQKETEEMAEVMNHLNVVELMMEGDRPPSASFCLG